MTLGAHSAPPSCVDPGPRPRIASPQQPVRLERERAFSRWGPQHVERGFPGDYGPLVADLRLLTRAVRIRPKAYSSSPRHARDIAARATRHDEQRGKKCRLQVSPADPLLVWVSESTTAQLSCAYASYLSLMYNSYKH